MADKGSTYRLDFAGNAGDFARESAAAVEEFSSSIEKSEAKIREFNADLRRLKGSSDEVKAAKLKLRTAIDGERQSVTHSVLELRKLGASSADVTKKQKELAAAERAAALEARKAGDAQKRSSAGLRTAITATGGPVADLAGKLETLSGVTEGMGSAFGVTTLAATGAVAGIAALVAVAGAGIITFAKFAFESQAEARSLNLMRVASTGAEVSAANLGTQVDALARKVPTSKTEINALAVELTRMGLRGQTVVDTMNAVAQASAGGGAELGKTVEDLITRGKQFGRFQVNPAELFGKGIRFEDIAGELAKQMNVGIDDARQALVAGTVPIAQGAAALRNAVERKFAGVNTKALKDPAVAAEKLRENLSMLTRDINIEPLLDDMSAFFDLFDPSKSTTGAALKQLATSLGGDLVDAVHESAPVISDFARGIVLQALKAENAWLEFKVTMKKAFHEAFGEDAKVEVDAFNSGMATTRGIMTGIEYAAIAVGAAFTITAGATAAAGASIYEALGFLKDMWDVVTGIDRAFDHIADKAGEIAKNPLKGFKAAGESHDTSVSTILKNAFLPGFAMGLPYVPKDDYAVRLHKGERVLTAAENLNYRPATGAPNAAASTGTSPPAAAASSSGELHLHLHVDSQATARALMQPSALEQLKDALRAGLLSSGRGGVPA